MSKELYNATIIPEIVKPILDKYKPSKQNAMDVFYKSDTAKALSNPETGLQVQSALFIFSQLVVKNKKHIAIKWKLFLTQSLFMHMRRNDFGS